MTSKFEPEGFPECMRGREGGREAFAGEDDDGQAFSMRRNWTAAGKSNTVTYLTMSRDCVGKSSRLVPKRPRLLT